ncbi:hypothetical protein GCM10023069_18520 [Shinella granuli]
MRISHEAIYQALYIQHRGALERKFVGCLRRGRALRIPRPELRPRHGTRQRRSDDHQTPRRSRRPWGARTLEGDLIIGLNRSAIGTLVERSTRFTSLVHLPRQKGYGLVQRTKNGPALAGYGAIAMANALKDTMKPLPARLRRSLTWDRGKELSDHARFTSETGVKVFFAAPRSPWQRGTNENTNGLLRQYFPKGTDLSRWTAQEIQAVAHTLNNRPEKTLPGRHQLKP